MAVDLTGGMGDEREYVFAEQPDNPEMRESVNIWLWDKGDQVGIPRIGIEAVADQWETHDVQVNMASGDGRVFTRFGTGRVHDPMNAQGQPATLGAGPLSFELVEPFRHWRMHFDGIVNGWTCEEQIAGGEPQGDPSVRVQAELDLRSAVPPWENGGLLPEAKRVLEEQDEGGLMGGPRFEQLARAQGTVKVGDVEHRIDGGALRIRRRGIRRLYEWLDDDLAPSVVDRMLAWRADNPKDKYGSHTYETAQFGITDAALGQRFGAYRDRFGSLLE